jgi:hypothetical protein
MALLLVMALIAIPCNAFAINVPSSDDQIKTGEMATDLVIVRPVSIVTVLLGFGFFLVSSPFSALGGNVGEAWDIMVVKPVKFTFARPLGDFESHN